jgi:protein-ribulosamine 3-kinase
MNHEWLHWLKTTLNCPGEFVRTVSVSGGCIHSAFKVEGSCTPVFVKMNHQKSGGDMFQKEALGLNILQSKARQLLVPEVLYCGEDPEGNAVLVLEWICQQPPEARFWENFGNALAQLHLCTQKNFGLDHHNYIGSLVQVNTQEADWATFYIQHRIIELLETGLKQDMFTTSVWKQADALYKVIESDFPKESPALLHGDLWAGNFLSHSKDSAAIFDPAVYYGHRETEIAFTKLFGGFSHVFYEAYHSYYPLQENFSERVEVHQLYPLLVHALLFGGHYIEKVRSILNTYH